MTDQQNTEAAEAQAPQFSLQRIYVRDLSFEAPKSPAIFRQEWTPSVALDLNTRQKALEGDFHEVVLTLSVTVKNGEEVAFLVTRGSFPALMLAPVNFDALYAQELQRMQQEGSSTVQ